MEQRDCLAVSFMEEEVDSIEVQLKVFLRKYHDDEVFKHLIENTSECERFAAAWSWLYKEYPLLGTFAGNLPHFPLLSYLWSKAAGESVKSVIC